MSHILQCCDHILSISNDIISKRTTRRRSGHIFIQNNPNDSVQEIVLRNGMAENTLTLFQHTPDIIVVLFCIIALGVLCTTFDFSFLPELSMDDEILTKFETARQRYQEIVEA